MQRLGNEVTPADISAVAKIRSNELLESPLGHFDSAGTINDSYIDLLNVTMRADQWKDMHMVLALYRQWGDKKIAALDHDPNVDKEMAKAHWSTTINDIVTRSLIIEREDVLRKFNSKEQTDRDVAWDRAYEIVRLEEGPEPPKRFLGISGEALIHLADQVRSEADPIKRYEIVTENAPNGETWFDVLYGFSAPDVDKAIRDFVTDNWSRHGSMDERKTDAGLDIGSGTGRLAIALEPYYRQFVALDRVKPMLDIVSSEAEQAKAVQGDALRLPFSDGSFDLVTNVGLTGSLTKLQADQYYREVARVLRPGGEYIEGFLDKPHNRDEHPQIEAITKTGRDLLADMIVDTVSGKAEVKDHFKETEKYELFRSLGMEVRFENYETYKSEEGPGARLMVVDKPQIRT